MDETTCPACGARYASRIPYPAPRRNASIAFEEIALCPGCGLGMALPARAQGELDRFYAAGAYWNETVGASAAQSLHERNQCRHRVRLTLPLSASSSPLRALDVGAGHGWTAYWLDRLAGARVSAFDFVEPDDACSAEIRRRSNRFPVTRLGSLDDAAERYDLVFLNHVLEHVADPLDTVARIRSLLTDHGIAYFETPHADHRFKRDVFPHTWFFTPEALRRLGERAGVREHVRESFGRMPGSAPGDLAARAAYRAATNLGLHDLAGYFDDRVWRYEARPDGMWLRWVVSR